MFAIIVICRSVWLNNEIPHCFLQHTKANKTFQLVNTNQEFGYFGCVLWRGIRAQIIFPSTALC